MKYHTSLIPAELAEKLKEKGIHSLKDPRMGGWLNSGDNITYAEVFDWLMDTKRLYITIKPYWNTDSWESYITKNPEINMPKAGREIHVRPTWHEAANAAIEKALTLIK